MVFVFWLPGLLLLLAWLAPLHVLPWLSWHNETLATSALLAGCAMALWVTRRTPQARALVVPGIAAAPLLVAATALVQLALGRIQLAGNAWTVLAYAGIAVAACVAGRAATSGAPAAPKRLVADPLTTLAIVLAVAGALQAVIVHAQTLALWTGADWIARADSARGAGNLAQPNQAALLFVLAIASAAYLGLKRILGAAAVAALLLLLAAGFATTGSRSGLLAFLALFGWTLYRRRDLQVRPLPWAAGYAVLVVALFLLWPHIVNAVWLVDGEAGINVTTNKRAELWGQMLEAVRLRPWFGWGVMQVAEAHNAVAHRFDVATASTYSHNIVLDLALWVGVPLAALCVAISLAWLLPRLREARSIDAAFCVALVIAMLAQAQTEFPYAYSFFLVPVFFALGALDGLVGRGRAFLLPRPVAAVLVAAAIGLHAWSIVEYVRIEEDFRVARFEALRVGATPASYVEPQVVLLTQLGALLQATRIKPAPGMAAADLALLEAVANYYPWASPLSRHLIALALNGRMEEARRQLQVLRVMHGAKMYRGVLATIEEQAVDHPVLQQLRLPG
jgi:O-antigen ligase